MRKHLGLIAAGGFVAAALFLWGAWWMSGGLSGIAMRLSQERLPRCDLALSGQTGSREIAWNGRETVSVDLPADIQYRPDNEDAMVKVTGDGAILPHIVADRDEIKLDCFPGRLKLGRMAITLPGRSFIRFNLAGLTSLTASGLDQAELHLNIAGSSSVTAAGKVESLHINGAGLSEARLGALKVTDAHFNLAGKSTIEAAVEDSLELNAVGAATLTLREEPKILKTHVVGGSRIIHPAL